MDIEGFRKAGYAAVDRICDYYYSLDKKPVSAAVEPGFLSKSIPSTAPENPEPWSTIQDEFQSIIMPGITHWQHPNFYGYFPCNASFEGALADLYCASISNPGFNWSVSPSVTELEIIMMDWVAKMLGLDENFLSTSPSGTGGGIILGSASEVAVTVAIAARERCINLLTEQFPMPQDPNGHAINGTNANGAATGSTASAFEKQRSESQLASSARVARWRGELTSKLVMYGTTQTHTVGAKAALILGLDFRALDVKAEDAYALRGETLRAAMEEDEAQGRVPFMLIGTLGTTSSGAIDNLTEIVEVAKLHPTLWLHIDAAYAGVSLALPEWREQLHLDAINKHVDSFSTNLHKWGLVQFDCSPLLVRDRGHLARALTITPAYLKTKHGDTGSVLDLRNLQLSLGRRFRSLKVWFVLRSYGLTGFRNHLRTSIRLANLFEHNLRNDPSGLFEIVAPPRWGLVVFRIKPPSQSNPPASSDLDNLNTAFWDDLQQLSDQFVLTQTTLPEIGVCIRFVVGSPRTRDEHVQHTWKLVHSTAQDTWRRISTVTN
ncbi:PLP-dependent transferase [Testicularia cyperi]|uniref:PLP-dependent transferase n=1 Tax=Testicularia cyperi TaxID=1882483 RepID=A0A317XJD3_9BASI|nr:PLP-dependent transferase [Testicularia cyperi]